MLTLESYFMEKGFEMGKMEGFTEGERKGFTEGERKGKIEGKIETAKRMLRDGVSVEFVSRYTDLPIEEVLELKGEKLN